MQLLAQPLFAVKPLSSQTTPISPAFHPLRFKDADSLPFTAPPNLRGFETPEVFYLIREVFLVFPRVGEA
jgi:hypothetical protein